MMRMPSGACAEQVMLAGEIHLVKLTYSTYNLPVRSVPETGPPMFATEMQSCQFLAEGKAIDKFFSQPSKYSTPKTSSASTSSCSNFSMSTHLPQAICHSPSASSSLSTALPSGATSSHEASTPSSSATSSLVVQPPSQVLRASPYTQTERRYPARL
jgi:hypothetical protein